MSVVARLYRDMRGSVRHEVALDATLRDPERRPFDVVVEELSAAGVRVPRVVELSPGATVTLGISGVGMCDVRVVRRDERGYGCEFLFPLSAAELDDALAAAPAPPIPFQPLTPLPSAETRVEGTPVRARTLHAGLRLATIFGLAMASWTALYLTLGAA